MTKKEEKLASFILKLTAEERKKLKILSVQKNTTMQSLIRNLIHTGKTIEEI
jgi:hypothetical protein